MQVKCDPAQLKQESAIYKCPNMTTYMKAVNEASFSIVKDDVSLLKKKGELFKLAKQKVHEMGYQYAKKASRSKQFGECSSGKAEVSGKRKYISSSIRQDCIDELNESIKSTGETINLLLKQKEQYFNINKFQQAADVNSTIIEKTTEKHELERELKSLQQAAEKSKKYKKKKLSCEKNNDESSSQRKPKQKKLSMSSSSASCGSTKDGESSGADTLILSDGEVFGGDVVVVSDSSPVLFDDDPDENELKVDVLNVANDDTSPPASQVPCSRVPCDGAESENFWKNPK